MDNKFLNIAYKTALKNTGYTHPNPSVAAILVKNGLIIDKTVTGQGGSPHSEEILFKRIPKTASENADLYVTLEPCGHFGKNPPCIDFIIKAKIKRVIIGVLDENPLVKKGNSVQKLQAAGIEVIVANDKKIAELYQPFFYYIKNKKPLITVKIATSLDGKIALNNGQSKWITNQQSRDLVHLYRSRSDSILTAIGTVLSDNPTFDCRISGYQRNSTIILFDPNLSIKEKKNELNIIKNIKNQPLWIISRKKDKELQEMGVKFFLYQDNLDKNMQEIAKAGISSCFCEAGSFVSFLWKKQLLQKLIIIRAEKILGNDGKAMIDELKLKQMPENNFKLLKRKKILDNMLESYTVFKNFF